MVAVSVVTYVLVVAALFAVIRNRRNAADDPASPPREDRAERAVKLAVLVVIPVLFLFLIYDFAVARNINRMPAGPVQEPGNRSQAMNSAARSRGGAPVRLRPCRDLAETAIERRIWYTR